VFREGEKGIPMDLISRFLIAGIGFLLTLVFGFWMSKAGRPYNGILFNIHKLIALGTVIVTTMQIYKILETLEPHTFLILLIVITGISVVALFASGAFMSIGSGGYAVIKTIHNIAPVLIVIAMGLLIYLLNGRAV
jgi:hypothetical protein